jgi:hypothetical protein
MSRAGQRNTPASGAQFRPPHACVKKCATKTLLTGLAAESMRPYVALGVDIIEEGETDIDVGSASGAAHASQRDTQSGSPSLVGRFVIFSSSVPSMLIV